MEGRQLLQYIIDISKVTLAKKQEAKEYLAQLEAAQQTLALDGGDSAASEQLSTPEVLSTLQGESNPAHRK